MKISFGSFGLLCASVFIGICVYGAPSIAEANESVEVWWPTQGVVLEGTQPLKAILKDSHINNYVMFWQVDGGSYVQMYNSSIDYPHKEAMIDVTNWNWNSSGEYKISFIAQDLSGKEISRTSVLIKHTVPSPAPIKVPATTTSQKVANVSTVSGILSSVKAEVVTPPVVQAPVTTVTPPAVTAPLTPVASIGTKLYVDPQNPALHQALQWIGSRPNDALVMQKLGAEASAIWLGGWNADVQKDVQTTIAKAKKEDSIATFIAYNVPGRDCGSYSAGGLGSKSAYLSWITQISNGLGDGKAIVVLEPDALAGIECLSSKGKEDRYAMLSSALDIFKANKNTKVYLDAGHAQWIDVDEMAARLKKAGISKADGFSLNVSNFVSTSENIVYGEKLSKAIDNAHFIIDTSRNGNGSNGEWCNPSGRALGQRPTFETKNSLIDAFLWLKKPGESDGSCNGGPNAGEWWPEYGLGLAKRAGF